jgi:hypothetical protein
MNDSLSLYPTGLSLSTPTQPCPTLKSLETEASHPPLNTNAGGIHILVGHVSFDNPFETFVCDHFAAATAQVATLHPRSYIARRHAFTPDVVTPDSGTGRVGTQRRDRLRPAEQGRRKARDQRCRRGLKIYRVRSCNGSLSSDRLGDEEQAIRCRTEVAKMPAYRERQRHLRLLEKCRRIARTNAPLSDEPLRRATPRFSSNARSRPGLADARGGRRSGWAAARSRAWHTGTIELAANTAEIAYRTPRHDKLG